MAALSPWVCVAASLAMTVACGPSGLAAGEVQMVGWSGERGDHELLLVDAATPMSARVLIAGRGGQRFGPVLWAPDGESLDLVREVSGDTQLVRVAIESGETSTLATFEGLSVTQVEFHRQPNGDLIGMSRGEGEPRLLTMSAKDSELMSTSLASIPLEGGDWHIASSTANEYLLHRDSDADVAAPATPYLFVLDAELQVVASYSATEGLGARCVGAPDGESMACHTIGENYATVSLLYQRGPAGWGAPLVLGPGTVEAFSADSQVLAAANGIYKLGIQPELLFSGTPVDPYEPYSPSFRSPRLSGDGSYVAFGMSEQYVADVLTGQSALIGRRTGLAGDESLPVTWSPDGEWMYRGDCDGPEDVDRYYCGGVFIARAPLMGSCVSTDPMASELLDKCETYPAVALTGAMARPRP